MPLFIEYPSWIHPEIFPGIPFLGILRWYGLMYAFAFVTAYFVFNKQVKEGILNTENYVATDDDVFSFFAYGIICLLIGARVFATLVYDTSGVYLKKPWLIFWPFDSNWHFTGLAGMSYHGGFIGGLVGMLLWCFKHKKNVFKWMDVMVVAIPLGYTFGRLGNFLNGELFGRVTSMPWGVVFPNARSFSVSLPWVQEIMEKAGMTVSDGTTIVNLPRHPSQLYEAFFEGIVLWAIMWVLHKKKPFDGFMCAMYSMGYGVFRFVIEYFREPDIDLGYRFAKVKDAPTQLNVSLLNISTGQVLCAIMIAVAIFILFFAPFYNRRFAAKEAAVKAATSQKDIKIKKKK